MSVDRINKIRPPKNKMIKKKKDITQTAAAVFLVIMLIFGMYILTDVLVPLLFAGLVSILTLPVVQKLEKWGTPRILAIAITLLLVFGMLALLVFLVTTQIKSLNSIWPQMISKGEEWIAYIQLFLAEKLQIKQADQMNEGKKYMGEILKSSSKILSNTLSVTTGFLANFSLIPLYVFLMLLYRNFLKGFLYKVYSGKSKYHIDNTVNKIKSVVQNYLSGLLLVILIVGILNTVSLLILGIPNAVFFGFFAAALVLLPYIGVAIGSLLPIIMALITKDSAWYAVGVAGSFAVIQFLEGNFITPYIVGNKVSINSLAAIVALILFGNLWGIAGLVLALPLTAILKVIFDASKRLQPFGYLLGGVDD